MGNYKIKKTFRVHYIDHELVGSGNNVSLRAVETSMPVDVVVKVDTTPFDNSVDRCGDHVEALTGSIVAFQTANIASKKANEKQIVDSVTSGFSSMIEQHLNLQNAGIEAEMHALAGELIQQCKELDYKHEVMSKDFNRIKSRYASLFETLNKELDNRLKQLIKPCFDFVSQVRQEQNRRIETSLLSVATTTGKESDTARIAIQASKMKSNAENLIATAKNYIIGNKSLNTAKTAYFMEGDKTDSICYTPVILGYSSEESSSSSILLFANPIIDGNADAKKSILNAASSLPEDDMDLDDKEQIGVYFNQRLAEINDGSARSQRITALMKELFVKNSISTFVK